MTTTRGNTVIIPRYVQPKNKQVHLDIPFVPAGTNDAIGLFGEDELFLNFEAISGKDLEQKVKDWGRFAAFVFLDGNIAEAKKLNKTADANNLLHLYSRWNDKVFTGYDGKVTNFPENPGLKSKPGAMVPGVPSFVELGKILKTASTWKESDPTNLKNYLTKLAEDAGAKGNSALVEELGKIYELASGWKKPPTFGQKVSSAVKTVVQKTKTVGLGPSRVAFLGLLKLNMFGMASDLQPLNVEFQKRKAGQTGYDSAKSDKYIKVRDLWYKWGGARGDFDKTVESGSKNKAILSADGNYLNVAGETVAMVTAATPLIVAIINLIGKKPSAMDAATEAKLKAEAQAKQAEIDAALAGTTPGEDENKIPTWVWIAGGAALVIVGGILVYKFVIKK